MLSVRSILAVSVSVAFAFVPAATPAKPVAPPTARGATDSAAKAFLSDPSVIRFAVIGDRNGGYRGRVFGEAIKKVNLLQPEFAVNVGDMIEGYTTDTAAIATMWAEFAKELDPLEAPFFRVPGNHDMGNPILAAEYERRFGQAYHHFVHKSCLFLCMNSEDPEGKLGDEQVRYFEKVLNDNPHPRWTFVFLHKPLWIGTEIPESTEGFRNSNWDKVERLLKGRPHTVFAGHTHQYFNSVREGMKYIVMSTTGGGSGMRGPENYGEFDHIALVTVPKDGPPRIANLMLDGIRDESIRSERVAKLSGAMAQGAVQGQAIRVGTEPFTEATAKLRLRNPAEIPLNLKVRLSPPDRLSAEPASIERVLAPMTETTVDVRLRATGAPVAEDDLPPPVLAKWTTTFAASPGEPVHQFSGVATIGLDRIHDCPRAKGPVTIDGSFDDWSTLPLAAMAPSGRDGWNGSADCGYRFATAHDENYLYVAVETHDDKSVLHPAGYPWEQDGVEIRVDARPDPERSRGRGDDEFKTILLLAMSPGETPGQTLLYSREKLPVGTKAVCVKTADGHRTEAAIPVAWLDQKQGGPWKEFRLNVAVDDQDDPDGKISRLLWWRPDWRSPANFEGSGTFRKK